MVNDNIKLTGELQIVVRDQNGQIKEQRTVPNLVVTAGKVQLASRMLGTSVASPSHMAVGTGNTAPVAGDTALQTQLGSRVALTSATQSTNVLTFVATFGAGVATGALTEAGIFNASTAGTMTCRTTFSTVNKDTLDSLTITWNLTLN